MSAPAGDSSDRFDQLFRLIQGHLQSDERVLGGLQVELKALRESHDRVFLELRKQIAQIDRSLAALEGEYRADQTTWRREWSDREDRDRERDERELEEAREHARQIARAAPFERMRTLAAPPDMPPTNQRIAWMVAGAALAAAGIVALVGLIVQGLLWLGPHVRDWLASGKGHP